MKVNKVITDLRRWVIRHCHHRCVWEGEHHHISSWDRAIKFLYSATGIDAAIMFLNHLDTQNILSHFPEVDIPHTAEPTGLQELIPENRRLEWTSHLVDYVRGVQKMPASARPLSPAFTVAIPFFFHIDYLRLCLESVNRSALSAPEILIEVLIVNDDPNVSTERIVATIPDRLRVKTRVIQNPRNLGICVSLNRAIQEARHPWVLHVDCDDILPAESLKVLKSRIQNHPRVRYISSRMLDIDADGRLLRCRLRADRPSDIITRGMVAGHLKAIRRDLFDEIGSYQLGYEGCQDYEFALRTSMFEPILFIPDYLYQYRWHGNTQSVSKAQRQAQTTRQIIDTYLLSVNILMNSRFPVPLTLTGPMAHQWTDKFIENGSKNRGLVVEICRPFSELNWRLFAIHAARWSLENHSHMEAKTPRVF